MNKYLLLTIALVIIFCVPTASGGTYVSQRNHFSITYDDNWSRSDLPYFGKVELTLECTSGICSKDTNVSISAYYEWKLRDASFKEFVEFVDLWLKQNASKFKNVDIMKDIKILRKSHTKLGTMDAYEIIMKYNTFGLERIRHDYWILNRGYLYALTYIGFPENHDTDFKVVKEVFSTFKLK